MNPDNTTEAIRKYWERDGLGQAILDHLATAGKNLDSLNIDDLAPFDQFHGGGKEMTQELLTMAMFHREMHVLDVGGGLGGSARTLAKVYGCHVTVADVTESYVLVGRMLTERLKLQSRVEHVLADALELPFDANSFDLVWTQNSGMNIPDKRRLYAGMHRILVPDGLLLFQEPMQGPIFPPILPVMWASDESSSFLRTPAEMRESMEAVGFGVVEWQDVTDRLLKMRSKSEATESNIQALVMGSKLEAIRRSSKRNIEEHRVVMVQGVLKKESG